MNRTAKKRKSTLQSEKKGKSPANNRIDRERRGRRLESAMTRRGLYGTLRTYYSKKRGKKEFAKTPT